MKTANDFFAPSFFAVLRFTLGALILLAIVLVRRSPLPPKHLWPWIILTGAMQIAFCNVAIQVCLKYIGSGLMAILTYSMPIWVAILARIFLKESLTFKKIAGIAISFTGIGILMNIEVSGNLWAILLGISVAVIWAISSIIMKAKLMACDMMSLTAWQMTAAAVTLIGYTIITGARCTMDASVYRLRRLQRHPRLSRGFPAMVLYPDPYGSRQSSSLPPRRSSIGVLSGCFCLEEPLTVTMGIGMVLILSGIVLVQRAKAAG